MKPKYSAEDIANYFLLKAEKDGQELLSNLKLQKLTYYAQGLFCVITNKPLFSDSIYAWSYGPVVPDLYRKYKRYQARGIPADKTFDVNTVDSKTQKFLGSIYDFFGQFSAIRLMEMAHSDQCYIEAGNNNEITIDSMKVYLKRYLKDGKK
jgi:uncharacterized phage-associated protein